MITTEFPNQEVSTTVNPWTTTTTWTPTATPTDDGTSGPDVRNVVITNNGTKTVKLYNESRIYPATVYYTKSSSSTITRSITVPQKTTKILSSSLYTFNVTGWFINDGQTTTPAPNYYQYSIDFKMNATHYASEITATKAAQAAAANITVPGEHYIGIYKNGIVITTMDFVVKTQTTTTTVIPPRPTVTPTYNISTTPTPTTTPSGETTATPWYVYKIKDVNTNSVKYSSRSAYVSINAALNDAKNYINATYTLPVLVSIYLAGDLSNEIIHYTIIPDVETSTVAPTIDPVTCVYVYTINGAEYPGTFVSARAAYCAAIRKADTFAVNNYTIKIYSSIDGGNTIHNLIATYSYLNYTPTPTPTATLTPTVTVTGTVETPRIQSASISPVNPETTADGEITLKLITSLVNDSIKSVTWSIPSTCTILSIDTNSTNPKTAVLHAHNTAYTAEVITVSAKLVTMSGLSRLITTTVKINGVPEPIIEELTTEEKIRVSIDKIETQLDEVIANIKAELAQYK